MVASTKRNQRQASNTRRQLSVVREPEAGDQLVSLSVKERIAVGNILPQQGNLINMRAVQRARENLSFTDAEVEEWGIHIIDQGGGKAAYQFDATVAGDVDIAIPARAFTVVADALRELDKVSKLEAAHLPLWSKFVARSEQETE